MGTGHDPPATDRPVYFLKIHRLTPLEVGCRLEEHPRAIIIHVRKILLFERQREQGAYSFQRSLPYSLCSLQNGAKGSGQVCREKMYGSPSPLDRPRKLEQQPEPPPVLAKDVAFGAFFQQRQRGPQGNRPRRYVGATGCLSCQQQFARPVQGYVRPLRSFMACQDPDSAGVCSHPCVWPSYWAFLRVQCLSADRFAAQQLFREVSEIW